MGALELSFSAGTVISSAFETPRLPSERRIRLAQPLHLIDQGHVSLDVTRFLAELLVLTDELEGLATCARELDLERLLARLQRRHVRGNLRELGAQLLHLGL